MRESRTGWTWAVMAGLSLAPGQKLLRHQRCHAGNSRGHTQLQQGVSSRTTSLQLDDDRKGSRCLLS